MLRRTKNDTLNGKPLLELPKRLVENIHCKFDPEERAFYDSVEQRVQTSLETLQKQGDMTKNYTSVLVLLLRLRQGKLCLHFRIINRVSLLTGTACNHPSLISQDYRKDKEAVDPKAVKDDKDLDDDADELADLMGGLGLSASAKRCQMCQREFVTLMLGHNAND